MLDFIAISRLFRKIYLGQYWIFHKKNRQGALWSRFCRRNVVQIKK